MEIFWSSVILMKADFRTFPNHDDRGNLQKTYENILSILKMDIVRTIVYYISNITNNNKVGYKNTII